MIKRWLVLLLLTWCLVGCGKAETPTSGGKSASYWAEVLHQGDIKLRRKAVIKLGSLSTRRWGGITWRPWAR